MHNRHFAIGFAALLLCACSGGGGDGDSGTTNPPSPPAPPPASTYTIGGRVEGLGGSVVLTSIDPDDQVIEELAVTGSGTVGFTFATALADGADYLVEIKTYPAGQQCSIDGGDGTIGTMNVSDILVSCVNTYTVGGTVSGLSAGNSVVLHILSSVNGGESLTVAGNGDFAFSAVPSGSTYEVTVETPPQNSPQTCSLVNANGTVGSSRVDNVGVTCIDNIKALEIAAGSSHSCSRLANGQMKCWGKNLNGQLGLEDLANRGDKSNDMGNSLPTVNLGVGQSVQQLSAGGYYTCALLDSGLIKCWGDNASGQLGLGDIAPRGGNPNTMGDSLQNIDLGVGRIAVRVAAGLKHACASFSSGEVKCWGRNSTGELGLGDRDNRGTDPAHMGDNLPVVKLGARAGALQIAAGSYHTCALLDDNQVYKIKCWGFNADGQLGLGDQNNHGTDPLHMGDDLPAVDLGTGRVPVIVATGDNHSCAIIMSPYNSEDSQVKCWGRNFYGQLGLGDENNHGTEPLHMGDNLPPVDLGTGRTATQIAAGSDHTCALLDNLQVKCWGYNRWGQLGLGDKVNRGTDPAHMGDNLPAVDLGTGRTARQIAAGQFHTCALLDNNAVKCWGLSPDGQLGQGDTRARGDGQNEMGDYLPVVDLGTP